MPNFTIEAEGETNPLSALTVISTLASASGAGASQQSLKVATQQLANWEKSPGYYPLLQNAYADFSISQEIRFLAIIQLKNGIDKYWRKTASNAINREDKDRIRAQAVIAGLREPVSALALQNALMLAKIVRLEFPHDWPDVISTLAQELRNATEQPNSEEAALQTSNILLITLQVIKELASGRLQRTRKSLEQLAPELLHVLGNLYVSLVERWKTSPEQNLQLMRNSHSAMKILRRLLIAGFEHPHRDTGIQQFWQVLQQHQDLFWAKVQKRGTTSEQAHSILMKHLFQLSKLWVDMARSHPASFVLLGCMTILEQAWTIVSTNDDAKGSLGLDWDVHRHGDDTDEQSPVDKLSLKALLLFRACIKMVFNPVQTFKYQHPQDKDDRKNAIEQIRTGVFTDDFVVRLMEILVTQYFVLRPNDLRNWEQEPDEWEKREEEIADAWEFSIRSCSEKLFLDLVLNFKVLLVPRLLQVFEQYGTTANTDVLLKDSLYSSIGIAAACIDDVFDFNSFLRNVLVPEVQMLRPSYNLLRRRTAILLGQWVPIQPEVIDRVAVYQIFTHLLSTPEELNDAVVRVTAGRQLRVVLEPFEFKYEDFAPYATPIIQSLMSLIAQTDLSETKMALLETVRVAAAKLEQHVEPYANDIMSMLPQLWAESGEEHLMKQAILTMITTIVTSLNSKSLQYHPAVLPLIHNAVQPGSEAMVYLLEEALELWSALIQHTTNKHSPLSQNLLDLSSSLLPLLEIGSELLRQILDLIESYTLLSPTTILAPGFLNPLLTSLKGLLSTLSSNRARDASLAPHVVENLLTVLYVDEYFDTTARAQAAQHLISAMIDTGYLAEVLRMLNEAHDYHENPRPNRQPPGFLGPGETHLFQLIGGMALLAPTMLVEAVCAVANRPVDWLVSEWIISFDSIGDVMIRKLQLLAMTNLLTIPEPDFMLEQLQSLMTIWTDVCIELGGEAPEEAEGDYLYTPRKLDASEPWLVENEEALRKQTLQQQDPVYSVNVRHFIADRLRKVIETVGGMARFEEVWLSRVDRAVLKAFTDLKLL